MEVETVISENQALSILVGNWLGKEQIYPSPFDPKGGAAIGRVINRTSLFGFAVIQDYEQERDGKIVLLGHGIFRWDASSKKDVLYWFDSSGLPPVEYRGTLHNRILTLTAPQAQGFGRAIFDFSDEGRYHYRMEVSLDGDQWHPFVTGEYQKT
jgi:hypothetical protein